MLFHFVKGYIRSLPSGFTTVKVTGTHTSVSNEEESGSHVRESDSNLEQSTVMVC